LSDRCCVIPGGGCQVNDVLLYCCDTILDCGSGLAVDSKRVLKLLELIRNVIGYYFGV